MEQLKIQTHLSANAAMKVGSIQCGNIDFAPTEEQLAALDPAQRIVLSKYVSGTSQRIHVKELGFSAIVLEVNSEIAEAVRKREERAAQIEEECASYRALILLAEAGELFQPGTMPPAEKTGLVKWPHAPNYSRGDTVAETLWSQFKALREAKRDMLIKTADAELTVEADIIHDGETINLSERAKVLTQFSQELAPNAYQATLLVKELRAQAKTAREVANKKALRELIADFGTKSQLERFDAEVLPEEERAELVRSRLFVSGLLNMPVYDEISEQEVAQLCACEFDDARFSTDDYDGTLSADQWERLQAIRTAAPSDAVVVTREHIGYAKDMTASDDPEIRRLSFRVTITFAGEKYSLELAAE